jgi:hypothetical protein
VRVFFTTCEVPYRDAAELIASVTGDRVLEVTTVASDADRRHPMMDSGPGQAYDPPGAGHGTARPAQRALDDGRGGGAQGRPAFALF